MLAFSGSETKAHKPSSGVWPKDLEPHLMRYLDIYRPLLCNGRYNGDRLWVSQRPGPLTDNGIYYAITTRTRTAFGQSVNPHLFRDCAATSVAVDTPENIRLIHHLIGNSFATMQKHYNQARSIEASAKLNSAVEKLRRRRRR